MNRIPVFKKRVWFGYSEWRPEDYDLSPIIAVKAHVNKDWSRLAGRTMWEATFTFFFASDLCLAFSSHKRIEEAIDRYLKEVLA